MANTKSMDRFLSTKPELLDSTEFLIITTAIAPENSASRYLKQNDRDPNTAYTKLKDVCKQSQNVANKNTTMHF